MKGKTEEPASSPGWSARLAFLKTKRALLALTVLVIVAVILIALGATGVLTGRQHGHNASDSSSGGLTPTPTPSSPAQGSPTPSSSPTRSSSPVSSPTATPGPYKPENASSIADGVPLRLMCLGASIVRGLESSDGNGFRGTLRDDLASSGATVNMAGTQRSGAMPDNDFEAYNGNRIDQLRVNAMGAVERERPNVLVIQVGSNNVLQKSHVANASVDLESFLDDLLEASPRATIVLSTILLNAVPGAEPMVLDMNEQYRELFRDKYEGKAPVVLVELHPGEGVAGVPQAADISHDGTHPNDSGYELTGHLLAAGVKSADAKGYLRWPESNYLAYDGNLGREG